MARLIEEAQRLAEPVEMKFVRLGLEALGNRALLWFTTTGALGAWAWAIAEPTKLRLIAAAGYCLLVYVPMLWHSTKK